MFKKERDELTKKWNNLKDWEYDKLADLFRQTGQDDRLKLVEKVRREPQPTLSL